MTLLLHALPIPLHEDGAGGYRVGTTRVSLDTVLRAHQRGMTAEEIVASLDTLSIVDVYTVLAWAMSHPTEVQSYLDRREQQAEQLRQELEAAGITSPPGAFQAALRSRQRDQSRPERKDAPLSG